MNTSEEVVCTLCGHKATAPTLVEAVEKLYVHQRDRHPENNSAGKLESGTVSQRQVTIHAVK